MKWAYGSAVAVAMVVAIGCEANETDEGARSITLQEAQEVLEETWCARVLECECSAGNPADDFAECQANVAQWVARMESGETFDPACMGRFVTQLEDLGCDALEEGFEICDLRNGRHAEGRACMKNSAWSSECAVGLVCDHEYECVPEDELVLPGEGEDCSFHPCAEGSVCDPWGQCRAVVGLGEECLDRVCEDGTACELANPEDGIPRCYALTPNGEQCTGHGQCVSGYCPNGFCSSRPGLRESCQISGICADGLECRNTVCAEPVPAVCDLILPS